MPARLLVVQHEDECPPDLFGGWLDAAGVELDVHRPDRGADLPATLAGVDGFLVLGGQMGAGDDRRHPWLAPTKELIRAAVHDGVPFLGICLGHQLATVALGGEVVRNPRGTTRGLVPVALTAEGRDDPLLGPHDGDPSIHWNSDVATELPDDAVLLAATPDGAPQAVRFADRAWGVQFHPEATAATVRRWVVDHEDGRPVPPHVLAAAAEVAQAEPALRRAWEPLARRFAAVVTGSAGVAPGRPRHRSGSPPPG